MRGGRNGCGLWDELYSGIGGIGIARDRERADQRVEGRTFVFGSNALNGWFAVPLADVEGRSHYGRMEAEPELILLPSSFEHVDPDHLCRLIGQPPCSLSFPAETAWMTNPPQRTWCSD